MTANTEKPKGAISAKLVVVLVLLAVSLVFIFSNTGSVTLFLFGMKLEAPMWIWFLALLAIGVVIGSIFPWFRPRKKS